LKKRLQNRVDSQDGSSFAKMTNEASQGKHFAAQYASPRNRFTFCT